MVLPYEYILAVFFLLNPDRPPQMVSPAADAVECQKLAGQLAVEHKAELNDYNAIPICLKIELPKV